MTDFIATLSGPHLTCLGLALIHFLWQGLCIGIVLEIALALAGQKNAALRHVLCGVALAVMPVCLAMTYGMLENAAILPTPTPTASSSQPAAIANAKSTPPAESVPVVDDAFAYLAPGRAPSPGLNDWMPIVVAGWLIGVVILAARRAGGFIVLRRWRRRGVSAPTDATMELFRKSCARIGIDPRRACLKISTLVQVPMTMGWLRPIVLFPATLLTGLSTGEIELLLAHELAHIRRYDYLVNLLQAVVETLFFYHPVAWWISRRMRQERENACDDLVAAGSAEALAYAKVLLRLETLRVPGGSLAPAASGGSLLQRVQRLTGQFSPAPVMGAPGLVTLAGILLFIAVLPLLKAQTHSAPMSEAEAQRHGIAALVNGKPILWADVKRYDLSPETWLRARYSGEKLKQMVAGDWEGRREYYIDRELIVQEFEASGEKSPPSVQNQAADRLAFAVKGFRGDKNAFVQNLEKNGISLEQFNENNRRDAIVGYMEGVHVYDPAVKYLHDVLHVTTQEGTEEQKQASQILFQAKIHELREAWLAPIRNRAVIQRFDTPETDSSGSGSIIPTNFTPDAPVTPMTEDEAKQQGIVATVNQHSITSVDVDQQSAATVKALGQNYSGDALRQKIADERHAIVQALIDRWLIIDYFKSQGGFIPKSAIDERINDIVTDEYGGDRTQFLQVLASRKLSEEKLRNEIEDNAIVGYCRNKSVVDKVSDYYQAHLDLFPADDQFNVTAVQIKGSTPVQAGHLGNFDAETGPGAELARKILGDMKSGTDVSKEAAAEGIDPKDAGKPIWVTKDRLPGYWPFKWDEIEKMQPGQTSHVVVAEGTYSHGDEPDQNFHDYWILRVNDHRPAKVAATDKTSQDEQALLNDETHKIQEAWMITLRAKAKIERFDEASPEPSETSTETAPKTVASGSPTPPSSPVLVGHVNQPSAPSTGSANPSYADSSLQQTYISSEMDRLTKRLSLTPDQESILRATMEAVVHHDATETVDQTLKEILSPAQEAIWEQVKTEARSEEARMYAMNEMNRIATMFPLSAAQKIQVLDAFAPLRLNDQHRNFHTLAELTAQANAEESALAQILSPRPDGHS